MRFRLKILLSLVLCGALPAALLGWLTYRANRTELLGAVQREQEQAAFELARFVSSSVLRGVENLQLTAGYLPFGKVAPEEVPDLLRIPFFQLKAVNILALVDANGDAVAAPIFDDGGAGEKVAVDGEGLALFSRQIPLRAALETGAAVGAPYRSRSTGSPRVALAVRLESGHVLLAELSLVEIEERVRDFAADGGLAVVVDSRGGVVASSASSLALSEGEGALVRGGLATGHRRVAAVEDSGGSTHVAAFAPVESLGWGAVVERPADAALKPAHTVRRYTEFWVIIALLVTAAVGTVLSRGVTQPLAELAHAVEALAVGRYSRRVEVQSDDEFGKLGRGFNRMSEEIARRDQEIRAWSEQLQRRVDEKTRELRQAQEQVQRARRLAALASLGAGIAHELNTPLTAIIGLGTLLRQDLEANPESRQTLDHMLKQARRMANIVSELTEIAERERDPGGSRFKPVEPVQAAVEEARPAIAARAIALSCELADDAPEVQGDPEQLRQVVGHLLQNAVTAMPNGGSLAVRLNAVGREAIRLEVRDTGKGIAPELHERIFDPFYTTKDEPGRVGLGLSLCQQIVAAHHGQIFVESAEGQGANFSVILPAAGEAAHLT